MLSNQALSRLANVLKRTQPLRPEAPKPAVDNSLAAQIVRTAERVRTPGGFDPPPPPKGSLADQILAAGRKRRNET